MRAVAAPGNCNAHKADWFFVFTGGGGGGRSPERPHADRSTPGLSKKPKNLNGISKKSQRKRSVIVLG